MNYRIFGHSGLRVSEICLGTMTFGTEWGWGSDYEQSKAVFESYAGAGGNFIDTANRYTDGTSEKFVGEFIARDRDHFVLATKYSLRDRMNDPNFSGNHRKNLMRSVTDSLMRLQTDFIDVLWLHAWDFTTPEEEVMRGLDDLISRGLVGVIGISDTPAWVVAKCNTLAELRGWNRFAGLQIEYSLIQRAPERDLLPMAASLGLTVTPWGPLAGGVLTGKYLRNDPGRVVESSIRRNARSTGIAKVVVEVADELTTTATRVALAWMRQKQNGCIPIVGARSASHLEDSLQCLQLHIPPEAMAKLDEVSAVELGFPHEFLSSSGVRDVLFGGTFDQIIR